MRKVIAIVAIAILVIGCVGCSVANKTTWDPQFQISSDNTTLPAGQPVIIATPVQTGTQSTNIPVK